LGNFNYISWDLGPTLATWMHQGCPTAYDYIVAQASSANAMAQGWHHAILPLLSERDRRTEIRWGLRDFHRRFGVAAPGLWLPETAVDLLTLRVMAEEGVKYTILAPWQSADWIDVRQPYRVDVGEGKNIIIFFYDGYLSGNASFVNEYTENADRFVSDMVLPKLSGFTSAGVPPLVLVASDGELYGHHKPYRDFFLAHLPEACARQDVAMVGLWEYLNLIDVERLPWARINERTSWSCAHGIDRWFRHCPDVPNGHWKEPLRQAYDYLAMRIDEECESFAAKIDFDLWNWRDTYVDVASGLISFDRFIAPTVANLPRSERQPVSKILETLLRAQAARLAMFTSCAWFWDDPGRPETMQSMRFASYAAHLIDGLVGSHLVADLRERLAYVNSPITGKNGGQLLDEAESSGRDSPPSGRTGSRRARR
jgi:hypothetical protein